MVCNGGCLWFHSLFRFWVDTNLIFESRCNGVGDGARGGERRRPHAEQKHASLLASWHDGLHGPSDKSAGR